MREIYADEYTSCKFSSIRVLTKLSIRVYSCFMENITSLLREIKTRSRMSEKQIAARLGVSQPTVNRMLRGQDRCLSTTLIGIQNLHREISTQSENAGP